jgi:flavin-binding protein dodecin
MTDHVYKIIELTGSSAQGSDEAARVAVNRASETIENMRWFEVVGTRGHLENGKISHWQVTLKIGFALRD